MGSKRRTTTSTYRPPSWVEGGARQAVDLGRRIGSQQYTPYTGDRVAGLSTNEQMGIDLAARSSGAYQPYFDDARGLIERGTQQFGDADIQSYMNPYITAALDPTAREIREEGARALNQLDAQAASRGAFGGSRAALMRSEQLERTTQGISDLYARGMSDAYDRAVSIWGQERARDMMAGGQIMNLGQAVQQATSTDINTLMNTGMVDRSIQQAMADFDYQQFVEDRDWDMRNLGGLLSALQGTQGSYTTSTTQETRESGNALGQALGLAATIFGAVYNPAGAAAGMAGDIASGVGTDYSGGMGVLNVPPTSRVPMGDTAGVLTGTPTGG